MFGLGSYQVESFVATELGFEHNLGLLCKASCSPSVISVKQGVPELEYYLERCLLEAEGASFGERGLAMCASIVGDDFAEAKYRSMFGRELVVPVPPHMQVPELVLHPASTVGLEVPDLELSEVLQPVDDQVPGFCYLALLQSEFVDEARGTLGPSPTLLDLLEFGQTGKFLPDVDLAQIKMRRSGDGYHVDREGDGIEFPRVVRAVADDPHAREWLVGGSSYLGEFGVGADSRDILCDWISRSLGRGVRLSDRSLDLVTNSAALLGHEQKKQLRSLEAVGDAALSMMIARDNYLRGEPVERYQNLRSVVTSNKILTDKFVEHVPKGAVAFLPTVNPAAGVTGAKALESILGAIWLDLGDDSLAMMLIAMGFLDFPLQTQESPPMLEARVGDSDGDDAGYCYLELFVKSDRDKLKLVLGPRPTIQQLLRCHLGSFDHSALRRLGYAKTLSGWHVGEGMTGSVESLFRAAIATGIDKDAGVNSLRHLLIATVQTVECVEASDQDLVGFDLFEGLPVMVKSQVKPEFCNG